jgi:hypothetical protein
VIGPAKVHPGKTETAARCYIIGGDARERLAANRAAMASRKDCDGIA